MTEEEEEGSVTDAQWRKQLLALKVAASNKVEYRKFRHANACLTTGSPVRALGVYTEILTDDAPGHPWAFLNRSLCYILLNHPSLAAFDAWRAVLGGHWAKTGPNSNQQQMQIMYYTAMFDEAAEVGEPWTDAKCCANGEKPGDPDRWLAKPLADLKVTTQVSTKKRPIVTLANEVTMCAYYRLAYALFRCGGGALKSALDVINDANDMPFRTSEDNEQFLDLSSFILEYFEEQFCDDDERVLSVINRGYLHSAEAVEAYKLRFYRGLVRTRYTMIVREQYPWDQDSITEGNFDKVKPELEAYLKEKFPNCSLAAISRDDPHLREIKAPYLRLRAEKTLSSSTLFEETNGFYVWSSPWSFPAHPCDTCGAGMVISRSLMNLVEARARKKADQLAHDDAQTSEDASMGEQQGPSTVRCEASPEPGKGRFTANTDEPDEMAIDEDSDQVPGDDRGRRQSSPGPGDMQLCPECYSVFFCSYECHTEGLQHHWYICDKGLEDRLCNSVIEATWRDLPTPDHQRVLRLMMLKVISALHYNCIDEPDRRPLTVPWVRLLDGDLDEPTALPDNDRYKRGKTASKNSIPGFNDQLPQILLDDLFPDYDYDPEDKNSHYSSDGTLRHAMIPWSFENNVREVMNILLSIGGQKMVFDLQKWDGWMLNTLFAKVEAGTRITTSRRYEKLYNEHGDIYTRRTAEIPKQRPNTGATANAADDGGSEEDEECLVGSLHPLSTLVRSATRLEVANVKLLDREGAVVCRGIKPVRVHGHIGRHTLYSDPDNTDIYMEDLDEDLQGSDSTDDNDKNESCASNSVYSQDEEPVPSYIPAGQILLLKNSTVKLLAKAADAPPPKQKKPDTTDTMAGAEETEWTHEGLENYETGGEEEGGEAEGANDEEDGGGVSVDAEMSHASIQSTPSAQL